MSSTSTMWSLTRIRPSQPATESSTTLWTLVFDITFTFISSHLLFLFNYTQVYSQLYSVHWCLALYFHRYIFHSFSNNLPSHRCSACRGRRGSCWRRWRGFQDLVEGSSRFPSRGRRWPTKSKLGNNLKGVTISSWRFLFSLDFWIIRLKYIFHIEISSKNQQRNRLVKLLTAMRMLWIVGSAQAMAS